MYLMRIGAPGREKPAARLDDEHHVDLSDAVGDLDEASFAGGGLDTARTGLGRQRQTVLAPR